MNKNNIFLILLVAFLLVSCVHAPNTLEGFSQSESTQSLNSPYSLAEEYYANRDYENAITYYQIVLNYMKIGKTEGGIKEYWIKGLIGSCYVELEEYEQARIYIEEAIEGYINSGEKENGLSFIYQTEGGYYLKIKQYENALESFEKSLEYAEEQDNGMVRTYIDMAVAYEKINEREISIDYYNQAIALGEQLNNYGSLSNAYSALGIFYAEEGDTVQGHECFIKGMDYAELAWGKDSFKVADAYNRLAANYNLSEEYAEALECSKKALDIYQSLDGPYERDLVTIYSNIGYFHMKMEDYTSALEMMKKSYNITSSMMKEDKRFLDFYERVLSKNLKSLYERTASDKLEYEEWFIENFEN